MLPITPSNFSFPAMGKIDQIEISPRNSLTRRKRRPDQTLIDKLMISKSTRLLVISAPYEYIDKITPLKEGVTLSAVGDLPLDEPYDFFQIFVRSRLDVMELSPAAPAVPSDDGNLWFSYPRRSPNLETDIDSN